MIRSTHLRAKEVGPGLWDQFGVQGWSKDNMYFAAAGASICRRRQWQKPEPSERPPA